MTAVNGISLQAVVGENNNSGTTVLYAQLSGDAGVTWTSPQSITIVNVGLNAFTMGGASSDWGHGAWSLAQLSATNFRVRVTDVATSSNKDFKLDYLGAQVTYLP